MTTKNTLMLSTRENYSREFAEYGIVIGQSRDAGNDPTEQALDSLIQSRKKSRMRCRDCCAPCLLPRYRIKPTKRCCLWHCN